MHRDVVQLRLLPILTFFFILQLLIPELLS